MMWRVSLNFDERNIELEEWLGEWIEKKDVGPRRLERRHVSCLAMKHDTITVRLHSFVSLIVRNLVVV